MSHVLQLTDGTTTVSFNAGTNYLMEYVPRTPDLSVVDFVTGALRDGGERVNVTRRNVTESARVVFAGASTDIARAAIRSVETLLRLAEHRQQSGLGAAVYVKFQPGSAGDIYQSEMLSGKVELSDDALDIGWTGAKIEALVVWTRRFYWETTSDTELSISNGHGSGVGGIMVYNHDDATHDNYVAITGADILGAIPTPAKICYLNSYNNAARVNNLWVSANVFATPGTLVHILEAGNATGGTGQADAASSEGYNVDYTLAQSEGTLATWTITGAQLAAMGGDYFNILARFSTPPTVGTKVRLKVAFALTTLWTGPEIDIGGSGGGGNRLQSLGVVQLPPWLLGSGSLYELTLVLSGYNASAGIHLYLDFLQLSPIDGFRRYSAAGYGLAYGWYLMDDPILGITYVETGSGRSAHFVPVGSPIMLWPARDMRLYFLADNMTGGSEIERTATIKVYCRPRRLTF